MDKRTVFFVLALSLAMFLVNMFFESQNQDRLKDWNAQQVAKKTEKILQLQEEIKQNIVKPADLPLVELYADIEGQHFLTTGIRSEEALVALNWTTPPPQKVFAKGINGKELVEYQLANEPQALNSPVIYQKNLKSLLTIAPLPDFGKYDLQLIVPHPFQEGGYEIILANLADGHLTVPAQTVAKLQNEINQKNQPVPTIPDSIVLMKNGDKYLPAALYIRENQSLLALDDLDTLSGLTKKIQKKVVTSSQKGEEKFYVLESPYQQLVFSNYGGALVEINLPFQNETNQKSRVKEIEFDREMVEKHPYNAHFPAHRYFTPAENGSEFVEHKEGKLGGYYPLLRRDLIEGSKRKPVRVQPQFYAFNIVSEYPETAELVYEVKSFSQNQIVFEAVQSHRRITKTFSLEPETNDVPYTLNLSIKVEGDGRGLWITSGIPEVEWISGSPAPSLKYRITRNQKADVESVELPKDSITISSVYPDWISNSNGFLGMILDPLTEIDPGYRAQLVPGVVVPSRLVEIDYDNQRFKAESLPGYMMMMPLKNNGGLMNFRIFAGPFSSGVLKSVDKAYANPATGYTPDYIASQTFHGWFTFISEPFSKFLFVLINFFHNLTGSWGFSIILLTVALRFMLYPLNAWSTKSMLKMQQIAPEVTAIQEKYKKDPKKAQLEIMNLYRDKGVNPISGCFPLLIQMPFLIGMFDLLKSTFELRGASFIPGWIDNLTAPDVLFSWTTPLPFIGNQFHLLPILTGFVMYLQQKMMSTLPKDKTLWTEQQRQQRFMGTIMAIVFAIMFYNFPSGLNIYFLSSMLLGILQQVWTARKMKQQPVVSVKAKEEKQKV